MKPINTKTHAVLDYVVGILLIAAPWIFNFANGEAAQNVPVTLGIITIIMSLLTKYEYSLFKVIGLNVHLVIDFLAGLFLAISPWLLGFSDQVYMPHVVVGIIEMIVVLLSERAPVMTAEDQKKYGKFQYGYTKRST
jgi:hypothetical protein